MRMRTKQKIHFLILNIRESIHSLARNRIIFMNLFFFSFSMGSLRLLFILFVAIEFTSTLAYNYGDPISVRIKYQYNEVFTLTLKLFDDHSALGNNRLVWSPLWESSIIQKAWQSSHSTFTFHFYLQIHTAESVFISSILYFILSRILSFSDHNVQSEWFIIQDGVGNYIQTLNMKLKVSNKELTSMSIVPICMHCPLYDSIAY